MFCIAGYFRDSRSSSSIGGDSAFYAESFNPITSYTGREASRPRDTASSHDSADYAKSVTSSQTDQSQDSKSTGTSDGVSRPKRRSRSSDNVSYERRVNRAPPLSFDATASCANLNFSYIAPETQLEPSESGKAPPGGATSSEQHTGVKPASTGNLQQNGKRRTTSIQTSLQKAFSSKDNSSEKGKSVSALDAASRVYVKQTSDTEGPAQTKVIPRIVVNGGPVAGWGGGPTSEGRGPLKALPRGGMAGSAAEPPLTYGEARGGSRLRSDTYMRYLSSSRSSLENAQQHSSRESLNSYSREEARSPPGEFRGGESPHFIRGGDRSRSLGKTYSVGPHPNPRLDPRSPRQPGSPHPSEEDRSPRHPSSPIPHRDSHGHYFQHSPDAFAKYDTRQQPQQQQQHKLATRLGSHFEPLPSRSMGRTSTASSPRDSSAPVSPTRHSAGPSPRSPRDSTGPTPRDTAGRRDVPDPSPDEQRFPVAAVATAAAATAAAVTHRAEVHHAPPALDATPPGRGYARYAVLGGEYERCSISALRCGCR